MRRPSSAALAALALGIALTAAPAAVAGARDLDRARALLARGDARAAATLLETALPEAPAADRAALRADLRKAYTLAARQAEDAGRASEARAFRDNLAILDRKAGPKTAPEPPPAKADPAPAETPAPVREPEPAPVPEPIAAPEPLAIAAPAVDGDRPSTGDDQADAPPAKLPPPEPLGQPEPIAAEAPAPAPQAPARPKARPAPMPEPGPASTVPALPEPEALPPPEKASPARRTPAAKGSAAPDSQTNPTPPDSRTNPTPEADPLEAADADFQAGRYAEAGKAYAALYRAKQLPDGRRDHWAYCRMVEVVRRINAEPATPAEWAALHDEIGRIRALSPKNWFGEYLRNLVAQRSGPPRPADPRALTLRGAAPEEPAAPAPRRRAPAPARTPAPAPAPAAPAPVPAPATGTPSEVRWQVRRTANFCIFHADPALAEQVAAAAEATRESQGRRFGLEANPKAPRPAWVPKCDIYLYPTPTAFSHATGEPEESPGISRMGQDGGRIVSRQVHLRADHPNVAGAVLPHEVTHVVLADLFPHKPLPRWADEGLAVLAEPQAERLHRAQDLVEPLQTGRLFRVEQLVALDGPEGADWPLYYAQSVSLTRFFLAQGTTAQFIAFLQAAERGSFEAELHRHYKIPGTADLHKLWLAHARSSAPAEAVASDDSPARARR